MLESRQQIAEFELLELEGKQAEERLKHINAVLWAIHAVNQLVVREKGQANCLEGFVNALSKLEAVIPFGLLFSINLEAWYLPLKPVWVRISCPL